jgi:hypothetical protein
METLHHSLDANLGFNTVNSGGITNTSEEHTASIFRVEVPKLVNMKLYKWTDWPMEQDWLIKTDI